MGEPLKPHVSRKKPSGALPGPGHYDIFKGQEAKGSFTRDRRWQPIAETPGPTTFWHTQRIKDDQVADKCGLPRQPKFGALVRNWFEPKSVPGPGEYHVEQKRSPVGRFPVSKRWGSIEETPGPGKYWSVERELKERAIQPRASPKFSPRSRDVDYSSVVPSGR
eukprot:TRINITY_DN28043_c0_g1_i1.p1 TRINITY_DN28043_c0_g1~~TRINITY_DN28043_c0_g1_i1.p1  ORF type:complete len:164 (+),score=12.77 TRINITY_DN28043_c0_g1_i1:44-535(+)